MNVLWMMVVPFFLQGTGTANDSAHGVGWLTKYTTANTDSGNISLGILGDIIRVNIAGGHKLAISKGGLHGA